MFSTIYQNQKMLITNYLSSHCCLSTSPECQQVPVAGVVAGEPPVASLPRPQRCGDGTVTFTSYPGLGAYTMN